MRGTSSENRLETGEVIAVEDEETREEGLTSHVARGLNQESGSGLRHAEEGPITCTWPSVWIEQRYT
jgi:hypothetical protein